MRLGISTLLVTMYGLGGIQIGSMQSNVLVSQGLWYELYKSNTPQGHISKGSPASCHQHNFESLSRNKTVPVAAAK